MTRKEVMVNDILVPTQYVFEPMIEERKEKESKEKRMKVTSHHEIVTDGYERTT